jgi:hypothetical protein
VDVAGGDVEELVAVRLAEMEEEQAPSWELKPSGPAC